MTVAGVVVQIHDTGLVEQTEWSKAAAESEQSTE